MIRSLVRIRTSGEFASVKLLRLSKCSRFCTLAQYLINIGMMRMSIYVFCTVKCTRKNSAIITGIGISYPVDGINFPELKIRAGQQAPDTLLQISGMRPPLRLFSPFKNVSKFTILVFARAPNQTRLALSHLRSCVDSLNSFTLYSADLFQCLTIVRTGNENCSPGEKLGVPRFGSALYHMEGSAHERYGLPEQEGRLAILRPMAQFELHVIWKALLGCLTCFLGSLKAGKIESGDGKHVEEMSVLEGMADVNMYDS